MRIWWLGVVLWSASSVATASSPEIPLLYQQGGTALKMSPDFVQKAAHGIELIYLRDYRAAKAQWDAMEEDYPGSATRHVGRLLIYQSLMLENLDYRFEKQYLTHSALALKELKKAQGKGGNEGWEAFLRGGVIGIESIHLMRKKEYVASLGRGMEALKALEVLKSVAPDFPDPILGEGLYRYWRTVVATKTRLIPQGADRREEGLEMMRGAEANAVFVAPAATLALAYAHLEQRNLKEAYAALERNRVRYPDNVLNAMVLSRVLIMERKYPEVLKLLDHVQAVDTDNHRVHYFRSVTLMRQRKHEAAHKAIDTYLALPLENYYRAVGLHQKAEIHFRARQWDAAEALFREAIQLEDYGPSKRRLEIVEKKRQKAR